MVDPLEVLGGPDRPVDPDPAFTTRLRARLERALQLPKGVTVSDTAVLHPEDLEADRGPGWPSGPLSPYLAVAGAPAAVAFYRQVLGAEVVEGPMIMEDGRIGHVALRLPGGGDLMLSEEHPEIGVTAPEAGSGASVSLHLQVDDVDRLMTRAVEAGATVERAPADHPYGRVGVLRDPYGHRWMLNGPVTAAVPDCREGDAGYVSLWVADATEAASFFAAVLGWAYQPVDPAHPDSRHLAERTLDHGIHGGVTDPTLFSCYAVADLDAALGRVRAAGGTAEAPTDEPYGRVAMCTDDQGAGFALYQPPGGVAGDVPEVPLRTGDVAYVTHSVVDADAFRTFYGAVLGWRFEPGNVPDGWQITGVRPMAGVHGGHDRATSIPMYAVDDIDAAVEQVRAAGGQAESPEQHPYGRTSTCRGPGGVSFYLGQLS